MTREEVGLTLDQERRAAVTDLWTRVTLGQYTLMKQGECVLLVKGETIVWAESACAPAQRDPDQRQRNFD